MRIAELELMSFDEGTASRPDAAEHIVNFGKGSGRGRPSGRMDEWKLCVSVYHIFS